MIELRTQGTNVNCSPVKNIVTGSNFSPNFKGWHGDMYFTKHAEERCLERHILPELAIKIVKGFNKVTYPGTGTNTIVHKQGNIAVVVDAFSKKVVTVIDKSKVDPGYERFHRNSNLRVYA